MEKKALMMKCMLQLEESEVCEPECSVGFSCETTNWTSWSECSVTCGKGFRMRNRRYVNSMSRKTCTLSLVEKEMCTGAVPECEEKEVIDANCAVTQWSEWSPCTVTCGKGMKIRTRLYFNSSSLNTCNVELIQKMLCVADRTDCRIDPAEAKEICMQPKEIGACRGYFARWHYDFSRRECVQFIYGGCRGNRNNFARYSDCHQMCSMMFKGVPNSNATLAASPIQVPNVTEAPPVNCMVTPWSVWSACSRTCGNGRKERRRMIKVTPLNGGKPCPRRLTQRRKCKDLPQCSVDCMVTPWGAWSACSTTCGQTSTQQRTREIKRPAKHRGAPCEQRVERRLCDIPLCSY